MNSDREPTTPAMQLTFPLPYLKDRPKVHVRTTKTQPNRGKAAVARPNPMSDGTVDNEPVGRSRSSRAGMLASTNGRRRARPWRLDERTCEIGRRGVEAARALLADSGAGDNEGAAGQAEVPTSRSQAGAATSHGRRAGRAA